MAKFGMTCAGKSCPLREKCARFSESLEETKKDLLGSPWFVNKDGIPACLEFLKKED